MNGMAQTEAGIGAYVTDWRPEAIDTEDVTSSPTVTSCRCCWTAHPRTHPALLFRFSALPGDAHRIHYDEPYTTGTEGYPVHASATASYA
jgi:hypothetical protein